MIVGDEGDDCGDDESDVCENDVDDDDDALEVNVNDDCGDGGDDEDDKDDDGDGDVFEVMLRLCWGHRMVMWSHIGVMMGSDWNHRAWTVHSGPLNMVNVDVLIPGSLPNDLFAWDVSTTTSVRSKGSGCGEVR